MCDTFIALADATSDGAIIFGKNSDRPHGEIQDVVEFPAYDYKKETHLDATYLQIPQAGHTYAVILSKPRWMWGAEMGANEHGVVIGNEAVWTNQPYRDTGLLGMDLLRLGLERGATAYEALQVITALLEEFGQGGNCAEYFAMTYHNSFLIADKKETWVLETADKYWVAERLTSGTRSISNNLSIRGAGDLRHADLEGEKDLNFAKMFSADGYQQQISPYSREGHVRQLCRMHEGLFDVVTAQSILRSHEGGICMHGEFETRGSQVSVLSEKNCEHQFIHGPFPCQQQYQASSFGLG